MVTEAVAVPALNVRVAVRSLFVVLVDNVRVIVVVPASPDDSLRVHHGWSDEAFHVLLEVIVSEAEVSVALTVKDCVLKVTLSGCGGVGTGSISLPPHE